MKKDATELNNDLSKEEILENFKIKVMEYKKSLESKGYTVKMQIGNIPIADNISTDDLGCIAEISKGNKSTIIIFDSNLDRIGQVMKDGEIQLEEEYRQEQQRLFQEKGFEEQSEALNKDRKNYLRNGKNGELEAVNEQEYKRKNEEKEDEVRNIESDLDFNLWKPLQIVELDIMASKEYAKLDNKINPKLGRLVLVRYPGNYWVTAQEQNGKYVRMTGVECLEMNREIVSELNITMNLNNPQIKSREMKAGKKDDDPYADFLYLRSRDNPMDSEAIVNYNRWGETDKDIVEKNGKRVEVINGSATYPPKIEIQDEVIELTSTEIQQKKDELNEQLKEMGGNSDLEKQIAEATGKDELEEVEKRIMEMEETGQKQLGDVPQGHTHGHF